MSRLFNGTTDLMAYSVPAASSGTGPNITFGTMLVVARILQSNGSWGSMIEGKTSGGGIAKAMGRHSNDGLYAANGTSTAENFNMSATSADNWAVFAATKATGTAAVTLIKCPIGGSVSSIAGGTSLANYPDMSSGTLRLGANEDFLNMRLAVAAMFQGIVLTTTEIQDIADTKTTQEIVNYGATWLVDDSDAFATDLVGSVDRTTLTGTSDDADDPSGWVYGLGGGNIDITGVVASATAAGNVPGVTTLTRPYITVTIS